MGIPRILGVFLCAAGAALVLAIGKALVVRGLDTLPPVKVLVFAATTFGLIAALLDWALLRGPRKSVPVADSSVTSKARTQVPANAIGQSKPGAVLANRLNVPSPAPSPQTGPILERAHLRPIVFREICPPSTVAGLSFYGGVPVGPAQLTWPRGRKKPGGAPLSFIMQWDCAQLAGQDVTGLLPQNGLLYLFCDLTWGDPLDFQFVHVPGPVDGSQALSIPPDLPPIFGDEGVYAVPYCSPRVPKEAQDVPRLLPQWPFMPVALSYPASTGNADREDQERLFWKDGEAVAEALLLLQHPEGVPPARWRDTTRKMSFGRPFPAFPHDYAAVRVVVAKVLEQLRRPDSRLMREASEHEREARFQTWRDEAVQLYSSAVAHRPAARVEPSLSDNIWHWMEGLDAILKPGWSSLVEECVNVSLGLGSEAGGAIPADLVTLCAERHQVASAYLHEEYPDRRKPDAMASWDARKAAGLLKEVRSIHAPCPNHMFGPPSFVQGDVEEYLEEWVLLLELSSREPISLTFGDGVLQFMIRPADLRKRQFDNMKAVISSY